MEPATTDRIQRMIDAEATERFPPDAVPQLALLRHGDHPVIEPGELYLLVILGQDGATRDAWMDEHFGRLEDFRARRLPEVKGFWSHCTAPCGGHEGDAGHRAALTAHADFNTPRALPQERTIGMVHPLPDRCRPRRAHRARG